MPIVMQCPKCRATFHLPDTLAGKNAKCSRCQQVFPIPASADVPTAERADPPTAEREPVLEREEPLLSAQPIGPRRPRPRRESHPENDRDQPPPRAGVGWIIALAVGVPVTLVLLLMCGFGGFVIAAIYTAPRSPVASVAPYRTSPAPAPIPSGPAPTPIPPPPPNPPPTPPPPPREPPPPLKPPAPVEITPTAMNQDELVKPLPTAASDVVVGGGGRFLILYLAQQNKLAVFDVSAADMATYLTFNEPDLKFAAGMDKLIVFLPKSRELQSYSLQTFDKMQSAPPPFDGDVDGMCMGAASNGPLWVQSKGDGTHRATAALVDPSTLKEWPADWSDQRPPADAVFLRASDDGQVFTMRNGVGGEPHDVMCVVLQNGRATIHKSIQVHSSFLNPDRTGRVLYTGAGLYTNQLTPIFPNPIPESFPKAFLPAHGGPYFARLDFKDWWQVGPGTLSFFLDGTTTPFATLPGVEGVANEMDPYGKVENPPPFDRRVHIIAPAKLVVSLPKGESQLVLHRFDPEEALEKSGMDYLVVTSTAPPEAKKGQEYAYQLTVKSSKGGVKYKLESGPKGMAIDAAGKLTWTPPADAGAENDVIVSVKDAGGRETLHSFRVGVE